MAVLSTTEPKKSILLRNRDFFLYWLSRSISGLGDGLHVVAIGLWSYRVTGSVLSVSLVIGARTVAPVIVSPIAGMLSDRLDRRKVLVWAHWIRFVLVGVIAYSTLYGRAAIPWIVLCTMLVSVASAFSFPASQASTVCLVDAADIPKATAMQRSTDMFIQFFAPMLGGLLIATMKPITALMGDAFSFAIAAVLVGITTFTSPRSAGADEQTFQSYWRDFADGWHYLRTNSLIFAMVLMGGALSVFGIAQGVVMTAHSLKVWQISDIGYGVMLSGFPLGLTIGAGLIALRPKFRRRGLLICGASFLSGLFGLLIPLAPSMLWAYPVMVVAGGLTMLGGVMSNILFYSLIPAEMQGRVFGFYAAFNSALMPLGAVMAGVADVTGTVAALFIIAGGWLLSSIAPLLVRAVREAT